MAETFDLGMDISEVIWRDFCARSRFTVGGESYEVTEAEPGYPVVIVRQSDGRRFAVDLIAEVTDG